MPVLTMPSPQHRKALFPAFLLLVLALALAGAPARAHTIPGGLTLSERVALSDVVVVATIRRSWIAESAPGKPARLVAEAAPTERLRGEPPTGPLRFEPHSHSGEAYPDGERVVLFLRKKDPEEMEAASPGKDKKGGLESPIEYTGIDDVSDRVSLGAPGAERPSAAEVVAAVRGYSEALSAPEAAARSAKRKATTLALLGSADAKLRASALKDLAQGSIGLEPSDAAPLLAVVDGPDVPMTSRVLLLDALARRDLVDPGPRYIRWLEGASLADMAPLARAMGRRDDPAVRAALVARLADADDEKAALAARALADPTHDPAASSLAALAADKAHPRASTAAIESLGRIGTPAARTALAALLEKTEDPARKRAIQTQLNLIAQRTPAPPPSASTTAAPSAAEPPPGAGAGSWWSSWEVVLLLGLAVAGVLAWFAVRKSAS